MAKKGMKRIDSTQTQPKNTVAPVPQIGGKAKHTKQKARPVIAGTTAPNLKVYHSTPFSSDSSADKPVASVYKAIDTDLARDNLENDITAADLQDM